MKPGEFAEFTKLAVKTIFHEDVGPAQTLVRPALGGAAVGAGAGYLGKAYKVGKKVYPSEPRALSTLDAVMHPKEYLREGQSLGAAFKKPTLKGLKIGAGVGAGAGLLLMLNKFYNASRKNK
jgi:hypothetical protein